MAKIPTVRQNLNYQMGNMPNLEAGAAQSILSETQAIGQGINSISRGLAQLGTSSARIGLYKQEEKERQELGDEQFAVKKWIQNKAPAIAISSIKEANTIYKELEDDPSIFDSEDPVNSYLERVQKIIDERMSVYDNPNLSHDDIPDTEKQFIRPENFEQTGNERLDRSRKLQQYAGVREYYGKISSHLLGSQFQGKVAKRAAQKQALRDQAEVNANWQEINSQQYSNPKPQILREFTNAAFGVSVDQVEFTQQNLINTEKLLPAFAAQQVNNLLPDPDEELNAEELLHILSEIENDEKDTSLVDTPDEWINSLSGGNSTEELGKKGYQLKNPNLKEDIRTATRYQLMIWAASRNSISGTRQNDLRDLILSNDGIRDKVMSIFKSRPDFLARFIGGVPVAKQLTEAETNKADFYKVMSEYLGIKGKVFDDNSWNTFMHYAEQASKSNDPADTEQMKKIYETVFWMDQVYLKALPEGGNKHKMFRMLNNSLKSKLGEIPLNNSN